MKKYKKFGQGILIVKSRDSLFNADFSSGPRRLPDEPGTIYATDKALKYCLRSYLHDQGDSVFIWRRYDESGKPLNIDANYEKLYGKKRAKKKQELLENLLSSLDVRLFGATYAGGIKESITGPVQISYGINKYSENTSYRNSILSPFLNLNRADGEQQTLGSEQKSRDIRYVYDYQVNPNTLLNKVSFFEKRDELNVLTVEDIDKFKEAMCRGVAYVNSASKIGSESELFIYITFRDKSKSDLESSLVKSVVLGSLKSLVLFENSREEESQDGTLLLSFAKPYEEEESQDGTKSVINISKILYLLENYKEDIEDVEVYHDPVFTKLRLPEKIPYPIKHFHIGTLRRLPEI